MIPAQEPSYRDELAAVLRQQDPGALRAFLTTKARQYGNLREAQEMEERSDGAMVELLHRMVLARADLADIHPASQRWLRAHGAA